MARSTAVKCMFVPRSARDAGVRSIRFDDMLGDDDVMSEYTGMDMEAFWLSYQKFVSLVDAMKKHHLFFEDGSPNPGNRCKCSKMQVLLISLVWHRRKFTQYMLAWMAGVNQSTISRYLKFTRPLIRGLLPTPERLAAEVAATPTAGELRKELVPRMMLFTDGTFCRIRQPNGGYRKFYSGKRHTHTYNFTVTANTDNLVLHLSKSFPGPTHDYTMVKEDPPVFGRWADRMTSPRTPGRLRFTVFVDLGYLGILSLWQGIRLRQPIKRQRRKKGEKEPPKLTPAQKEYNKWVASWRALAEHAISRIKVYGIFHRAYRGTQEDFDADVQIAAGLSNLRIMCSNKRYRPLLLDMMAC